MDRIALRIANVSSGDIDADITYTADDGGGTTKHVSLGMVKLGVGEARIVEMDLAASGLELGRSMYSARAHVSLEIRRAGLGRTRAAMSPILYFHPTAPGELLVYSEVALHEQYNHGDYLGRHPPGELREPEAVIDRVLHGGAGTVASSAADGKYNVCIQWQVETSDSCDDASCGIPFGPNAGGHEDYYSSCNDPGCEVPARGVRVKVARAGWSATFDADERGCFSFSDSGASYTMAVYGHTTNPNGTVARIHDDPNDFSASPGRTYSLIMAGVTPTEHATNTYRVGAFDRKWTTMAALGHGIFIWRDSLTDKAIHVALDSGSCYKASAHYHNCHGFSCDSNGAITSGRHYLFVGSRLDAECSAPAAMSKFTVAHELGHAVAALWYGGKPGAQDGGEPANDSSLDTVPNSCGGGPSYSMRSKEYNNIGFREGFAHFIAGRIWNAKEPEAAYMWYEDDIHDMERWGFGSGSHEGGRLENECSGSWASAGTNEDWMRFFWDWYTNTDPACTHQPDGNDMLDLYAAVRLRGGLTSTNYPARLQEAAATLDLPPCLTAARIKTYARFNGIDRSALARTSAP